MMFNILKIAVFRKKLIFLLVIMSLNMFCKVQDLTPVNTPESAISGLFSFSATVKKEKIPSVRLYIHYGNNDNMVINLLTPVNSKIATVVYNGQSILIVNDREEAVYRINKKPFNLKEFLMIDLDMEAYLDFYKSYVARINKPVEPFVKEYGWGKIISSKNADIVIIMNNGDSAYLKPVSALSRTSAEYLQIKIPENYRYYEKD